GVVMMAALVRVEFFTTPTRLTLVPMEQVARRLFANTELQRLHVWYQGEPIGTCQLSISPRAHLNGPESPAGITKPTAYYVHFIMRRLRLQIFGVPSQLYL